MDGRTTSFRYRALKLFHFLKNDVQVFKRKLQTVLNAVAQKLNQKSIIKFDQREVFVYVHFTGVVEVKVLFAQTEERKGDGKIGIVNTHNPFQEFCSK